MDIGSFKGNPPIKDNLESKEIEHVVTIQGVCATVSIDI